MRKSNLVIFIFLLTALLHWQRHAAAQQLPGKCADVSFSSPPTALKTFQLIRVEGQAVYAAPSQRWELGSGNGVCVTLFNKKSRNLVAGVTTDGHGQFEFVHIAPGEYVLLAFAGELQKIIIPIQVVLPGRANKPQGLVLHLRDKEDKRQTYVTPVTNLALRKELLAMVGRDQTVRNEMIKSGAEHPSKAILARMKVIDSRNTTRMRSIIKKYGWPGLPLVGWDGTEAAFTLVQHADHSFQKELLPLIEKEYKAGDLSGPDYAFFLDRVLVGDGRPQVYGTQVESWKDGEPMLYPITDEADVDKRRAEVGLSSLASYREFIKKMYHPRSK
jgi:uncharacterized protein DUF6624